MGGKPSKGTKADKRLKRNRARRKQAKAKRIEQRRSLRNPPED